MRFWLSCACALALCSACQQEAPDDGAMCGAATCPSATTVGAASSVASGQAAPSTPSSGATAPDQPQASEGELSPQAPPPTVPEQNAAPEMSSGGVPEVPPAESATQMEGDEAPPALGTPGELTTQTPAEPPTAVEPPNAPSTSSTLDPAATAAPAQPDDEPEPAPEPEPVPSGDETCAIGVWDGSPPQVLELSGDTFAHDPTMVAADGVFYRFWTGDNIPAATSTDLLNWRTAPAVYQGGYSDWVGEWRGDNPGNTFNFPWAPDVSYFGGRFHLYSSFSAFFGRNISCITHLSTEDPASNDWTDHGPVICTDGSQPYNAIDADVGLDAEGNAYLSFGSFWDGLMAFPLDAEGNRVGEELTHLAWAPEIEAPVLFRRCGYYYLFVTWGLCCPGEGRSVNDLSYRVAVGRSENILGPYVDRDGVPLVDGGGTLLVEGDGVNFAAAGHSDVIVSGDTVYHFYHAYRQSDGGATLRIVELPFDDEGWPVPGGP